MRHASATLTEGPVGRTLLMLSGPMLVGHLGMILFNLADTYFVGQLGTDQLAALSFTFPVVMVLGSLALGMGVGATTVISRTIGEGDFDMVRRYATDSLILSIMLVITASTIGILTIDPLFRLLGAGPQVLPLIRQYMIVWYPGMMFVVVPMVGNSIIRAAGDTVTPTVVMLIAVAVNLTLDPLLIFGWGPFPRLEIAGAAIATLISRSTTFIVSLLVLHFRYRMLTRRRPRLHVLLASWRQILFVALPAAGSRIITPLGIGVLTGIVAGYGKTAVAAYGVALRLEFFALAVPLSLSGVLGPFVGQNWGAGLPGRVRDAINHSFAFSAFYGLVMYALLASTAPFIAPLFNHNPAVVAGTVTYLRIVPVSYSFIGSLNLAMGALNVLNRPYTAAGLSILQMFALTIPFAWAGSSLWGLGGMFSGIAAGGVIAGVASWIVTKRVVAGLFSR